MTIIIIFFFMKKKTGRQGIDRDLLCYRRFMTALGEISYKTLLLSFELKQVEEVQDIIS